MYKEIDIEQWERKDIYAAFSSFNNPCTAVTASVCCTGFTTMQEVCVAQVAALSPAFTLNRTDESEASVGLAVVSPLPKLSFMSIVADDGWNVALSSVD